jgi:hypothetical protein
MLGLEEVQPAFGVSEEELQGLVQNGIIHYDESVEVIIHESIISSISVQLSFKYIMGTHPRHTRRLLTTSPPRLEHTAKCPIARGTGADIYPNASRLRASPWARWDGEDGARSYNCAELGIPVYQIGVTG